VAFGLPGGALIAGQWQREGLTLAVHDPHDGAVVGAVADNHAPQVNTAVDAVSAGITTGPDWPLWQRREALEQAARLVAEHTDRLTTIINAESGKTLGDARREVGHCAETLRLCAAAGSELRGETLEFDDSARSLRHRGWFTRRPIGVVAAITPFNDPLNLVAHKIGPALLAGNGVVLKPAEVTPFSALALVDLLLAAGVSTARIAVVCGGAATGAALIAHPDVDLISFTGGPATAARIAAHAGPKKLLMELGGNNPTIVRADADIDMAAAALTDGAFGSAGQNCLSVQRIYAHEAIYSALVERVVTATRRLTVGSATDRDADIGPMITEVEADRVQAWVDRAAARGAVVHTGGHHSGAFFHPTVLSDVPVDAEVLVREIFGPVVILAPIIHRRNATHC
jgi:glyceraldehyde-3-phosphate dehydrogenase (NADP+)